MSLPTGHPIQLTDPHQGTPTLQHWPISTFRTLAMVELHSSPAQNMSSKEATALGNMKHKINRKSSVFCMLAKSMFVGFGRRFSIKEN